VSLPEETFQVLSEADQRSIILRALCYYLIDEMPEEGIPSALDYLTDEFEFYATELQPGPAASLPEKLDVRHSGLPEMLPSY
jgi:hypothetical protein